LEDGVAGKKLKDSLEDPMQRLFTRAVVIGLIALVFASQFVKARVHEVWPAAKLVERADVVVIARFISSKDAKNGDKAPEPFPDLVGVESTFKVLAVIKGKLERKQIVVFHFRYPKTAGREKGDNSIAGDPDEGKLHLVSFHQTPDIDGPCLLRFESDADDDPPRYLMFLKKRKDGRYECVSGQVDPDVSVNKLERRFDDVEE
jgi:hypothetical protein